MVEAKIQGQGLFLSDGQERLYLIVSKKKQHGIKYELGKKLPITVVIGGKEYKSTIGARANLAHLFVGSILTDVNGEEHKQTHVLLKNGYTKNQDVYISVTGGNKILLSANNTPQTHSQPQDNNYLPTKEDFESAYRALTRPGETIAIDAVLAQLESNVKKKGLSLKSNWRMITEKNIEIWSKKR